MSHKFLILGPPVLQRSGKTLKVDTRKASALLAYLAVEKQTFQRDRLAAFLWPELDQSRARAALRRTLTPLNKALGKQGLLTDRETVTLNPDFDLWLDLQAFEEKMDGCAAHSSQQDCDACLAALSEAAALVRGDFMEGFSLRDSAAFDDWQFEQLEYYRRQHALLLEKLSSCHADRQEYETAVDYARRWLALDALHEPAHRALMLVYARSGDRSSALQQYRTCVRILDEELGVPPLEETNQLYNEILEGRITPEAPPPRLGPAAPPAARDAKPESPPMVGRDAEWDALLRLSRSAASAGVFVALEGEIGIGKTRLAEEFLGYAQRLRLNGLSSRCYQGENNLAYAPFISALRTIEQPELRSLPPLWQSAAALLLPQFDPPDELPAAERLPDTGAQSLLFEAVRQLLANFSRQRPPGLLIIDDLQWADSASLDLLTYLVRRLRDLPLMILGTWRTGDVPAGHPLRSLLAETQRAGYGSRILLDRLKPNEVDRLAGYFPNTPDSVRDRLFRETEGLPFFIVEYLLNADTLTDEAVPTSIHEIQLARMETLNEAERQLLTTAAVIGRSADYSTLREASGRSEEEAVNALEGLLAKNMLVESRAKPDGIAQSPIYDFTHETLYRVVYDQSSLARRRLLHRRTAEALAKQTRSSSAPNPLTAQIARHLQLSGQESEAAEYYYQAGRYARSLFANEEALGHFRTALALGHPEGSALQEDIADLLTLKGNYTRAGAGYETAAALAEAPRVPNLERKLGVLHHRRGDFDLAASHFQAALEGGPESHQALVYADWSRTEARRGDLKLAGELAQKGLKLAEKTDDDQARGQAHNILGIIARMSGEIGPAGRHLEKALDASGNHPFARAAALNNLALLRRGEGDYDTAAALAQEALGLCVRLGDRHREAALRNHLADIYHAAGSETDSMAYLKQAVEIFAEIGLDAGDLEPEIWKLTEW